MGLCMTETLQELKSLQELLPSSAEHLHTGPAGTAATSHLVQKKMSSHAFPLKPYELPGSGCFAGPG